MPACFSAIAMPIPPNPAPTTTTRYAMGTPSHCGTEPYGPDRHEPGTGSIAKPCPRDSSVGVLLMPASRARIAADQPDVDHLGPGDGPVALVGQRLPPLVRHELGDGLRGRELK